jgi:hypothetical protein
LHNEVVRHKGRASALVSFGVTRRFLGVVVAAPLRDLAICRFPAYPTIWSQLDLGNRRSLRMAAIEPLAELWESMETAPLDGTPICVRHGDLQASVSWSVDVGAWVIGLATEPDVPDRILPWQPIEWSPVPGALE